MKNFEEVVLVRYGEIYLKGKNRGMFEKVLEKNIKYALSGETFTFQRISGRYLISGFAPRDKAKIISALTKVPGLHSISPAYSIESDFDAIKNLSAKLLLEAEGTFRVSSNRADKTFPITSMELSRLVGEHVLKTNKNLSVDLHSPETHLNIDVRENGKTYIFFENIECCGGMPVGSGGSGLLLLSGGIDSPVAGFMMAKRGVKITALHFESFPYTSAQAKEKVLSLAGILSKYNAGIRVYTCNISKIQDAIHEHCDADFMITLVRRFMLRIADKLAREKKLDCLITGESLAQVASQTMESITTISEAIAGDLPFFRPLIGFDKNETVKIAERIGTFETSIKPFDDCCTVFLPKTPVTRPKLERAKREERRLSVLELVDEAYKNIQTIDIK